MDTTEALRVARARLRLSASDVARKAGVSRQQLWRIEHGQSMPRPETLAKLEGILGITLQAPDDQPATVRQEPGYVLRLWDRLSPADREAMLDELVRRALPDPGLAGADEPLALAAR